jgi:hypothetical protein
MTRLIERYLEYRKVGFGPVNAFRFAWLVARTGARPVPIRVPVRHL